MKYLLVDTNNYSIKETIECEGNEGFIKQLNYAYGLNHSPLRWYTEDMYNQIKENKRFA